MSKNRWDPQGLSVTHSTRVVAAPIIQRLALPARLEHPRFATSPVGVVVVSVQGIRLVVPGGNLKVQSNKAHLQLAVSHGACIFRIGTWDRALCISFLWYGHHVCIQ